MIYKSLIAGLLSLVAVTAAQARGLDIGLGNETAQVSYLFESSGQIGIGGTDLGVGLLFNENEDVVFNGGILVTGSSLGQSRAFQAGVGVKGFAGSLDVEGDNDTVSAIGIGGKLAYIFPSRTPLSVSLEAYLAPEVTSFSDNERLVEALFRFEVEIAPTTRFYVGYRSLEVEFENNPQEYEIDDTGHLGIRFSF
jgi:hypothetical protein